MNKNENEPDNSKTDFGYQQVPVAEKAVKVHSVFNSVASKYDLMNDLMSFGIHRLWKRFTIEVSGVRPGHKVLDVAGGTGDLTKHFSRLVGKQGQVVLADINAAMLATGRDRLIDKGIIGNVSYIQANAENLPFPDNFFDCISIAFGLRNVTNKQQALVSMLRVLKPGGQLLILEFSKPTIPGLKAIYDAFSFSVIPKVGKWVTGDEESYRYLVESIRMHPDQATLKDMLIAAGFDNCLIHNLSGGIVALHRGYKA